MAWNARDCVVRRMPRVLIVIAALLVGVGSLGSSCGDSENLAPAGMTNAEDQTTTGEGSSTAAEGEGLTGAEVESIVAAVADLPSLDNVYYLDLPLFDDAAAKHKTGAARDACVYDGVAKAKSFIAAMVREANRVINHPAFPAEGRHPAQPNGYAYVWGAKEPNRRSYPSPQNPPATCRQKLWGLDCSGFLELCVEAAGLDLTKYNGNANTLNNPDTWNAKIPAEWGLKMVLIPKEPKTWVTGDIVRFHKHTGFVLVARLSGGGHRVLFLNSAGSPEYSCQDNSDSKHGPVAADIEKLKGSALWGRFQGVLRLVPQCALNPVTGEYEGDEEIPFERRLEFSQRATEVATHGGAIVQLVTAYSMSGDASLMTQANTIFENDYCPSVEEFICYAFRYGMFASDGQMETLLGWRTIDYQGFSRTCGCE